MTDGNNVSLLQWGISIAVPAAGLCGVAGAAFLTAWREKIKRKHEFLAKQLTDFYSPLLAIREELKARGELRVRISRTANIEWQKMCSRYEDQPQELTKVTRERGDQFKKIIEYNNETLEKEDIPAYHRMIDIFRRNIWLAEPSTVQHFSALLEFVNIWDRYLAGSLPGEVIGALNHSEECLYPLYDDLKLRHDELRIKLAKGKT